MNIMQAYLKHSIIINQLKSKTLGIPAWLGCLPT